MADASVDGRLELKAFSDGLMYGKDFLGGDSCSRFEVLRRALRPWWAGVAVAQLAPSSLTPD